MQDIPTFLLSIRPPKGTAEACEVALRRGRPPVIARVREGWLQLDLRTVAEEQEEELIEALLAALRLRR
jgi:L-seryl-tRNA(Ser) seleniumtransferase